MRFPWQRNRPSIDECVARALERGGLDTTGVAVAGSRRSVTLRGTVPDDVSRERAVDIARSVRGVRNVDDRLSVVPSPDSGARPLVPPPTPATYVVQPGDTLPRVAERVLGARGRWRELRALNGDVVSGTGPLPPGLKLSLPDV